MEKLGNMATKIKWGRGRGVGGREKLSSTGKGAKLFDTVFSDSKLRLKRTELLRLLWSTAQELHLKGKGQVRCNLHSIVLNKLLANNVENFKLSLNIRASSQTKKE